LERKVPILQPHQGFQEIGEIFLKLKFPQFAVIFSTIFPPQKMKKITHEQNPLKISFAYRPY
jgi:hypothetical protein